MADKKKNIPPPPTTQPPAGGDAPTGKKKRDEAPPEPEEIPKTMSQILREEAENRALARKQRFKRRWPEVTKVPVNTRTWKPPPRPKKMPRIFVNLPELKTHKWVPPYCRRRRNRQKLFRIPKEEMNKPLPECARLNRIWHNFHTVEPNKMMLQGSTACNSKKYSSTTRGAQTGCIAAVTRALLDEKEPSQFAKSDVDHVIDTGDKYYRQCMLGMKCYKGKPQLQLNQLSPSFFFNDTKYTVKMSEVERGVLAKNPDSVSNESDLQQMMNKRVGTTFTHILTLGRRHFLIWGHPPAADSGSNVKTVVYMMDPHALNDMGQPDQLGGFGAFLRYAGVLSFVTDFLANYADIDSAEKGKPPPAIVLSDIEILQKEPIVRDPTYQLDLRILKPHCQAEWESMNMNALLDKKIKHGQYALESLSAVSLATSRNAKRKKIKDFYQRLLNNKEPTIVPPVAPEKGPTGLTGEQMMNLRGEDFFLYCPKFDSHTFGRDDMIPRPQSETVLHSPVEIADKNFHSQFKQIDAEKWILRGTRHMASYRYQTFKVYTAVPCVVAAIATLRRYRARAWNEDTVDETLDAGYNIYRESLMVRGGPIRRLVLGELKDSFKLRDKEYTHKEKGIAVWGKLSSNDPKVFDLCRGIEHFYKESDSGLLQIPGELEMGIWSEAGKYYLYHPWPADAYGNRVGLQGGGKACVLRFNSVAAMCDHVHQNTSDMRRKPFCISNVGVTDRPEMPEPVNKMQPVAPDRWVVRGRFHEGDARFPAEHRARQATPAALVAIAQAHLADPAEWGADDVDEVLIKGDVLYGNTLNHLEKLGVSLDSPAAEKGEEGEAVEEDKSPSGTMAAADVLNRFTLNTYDCIETDVQDCAFSGKLTGDKSAGLLSLKQSLKQLFRGHSHAVLTARGGSLAVWKKDGSYYMFDPHGCDESGYPSDEPRAAAALVRIKGSTDRLADAIMGNLPPGPDDSFNLSPVSIIATKLNPEIGAPETKLESKAFQWINKGTAAIMLGPRGENSAIGKAAQKAAIGDDDMAGRGLALPAAAAFCAATPSAPPPHMHQEHMFNLLDAGAEYYNNFYKKTGRKEITPEDLTDKFEMGVNTFSIELGEALKLPLRLPDQEGEGGDEEEEDEGGADGGRDEEAEEEEKPKVHPLRQIKEALFAQWCDLTRPQTVHLLVGDYHQLGVWMEAGGKLVAFDPAPTLHKGLLTPQRVRKGDELRNQRLKEEMTGEEEGDDDEDEEAEGEGEEKPEPEPEYVPPESCPALMVFASPGEFIDKLTAQGRLDKKQCLAPYKLYPVTVTNELTSSIKEKKNDKPKTEGDEAAEDDANADNLVQSLEDSAVGKYFTRLGRTKASLRGRIAQGENYFNEEQNRDLQDAANSVMGIVVDSIEPYIHWKSQVVDAILKYGDRLHTISLPNARHKPRIAPQELKSPFKASSFQVKLDISPEVVAGDIKAGDSGTVHSLKRGITQFFEQHKHGVLCAKNYCVGLWRSADDKAFCYWDPHFVGPNGKTSPAGAATLVAFSTVEELAETFKSNIEALSRPGTNRFTIASVKVDWELAKPGLFDSKPAAVPDEAYEHKVLTGYVETGKGKSILRGPRPFDAMKFSRESVQECSATAIVAACMSHARRAALWSKRTVRDITRAGAVLSERSMTALGYELRLPSENLMPLQVLKRFVLGVNYVCYDLAEAFSGKMEQSAGNEMSVRSALERFFMEHTHGILWSAPQAVAVWQAGGVPPYFMFDPSPCGPTGLRTDALDDAAPCVMTFTSPKMMAYTFLQNIPPGELQKRDFNLYAMAVKVTPLRRHDDGGDPPLVRDADRVVPATSKVGVDGLRRLANEQDRRHPPGDPTCKDAQRAADCVDTDEMLKGHRNPNGWLVLADKSQYLSAQHSMHCKKFSQASRGNQALSCAVMAVAMSKVEDVCRWCSTTLDQVLESGDQLYQDSYLHYRPPGRLLTIQQILRKFYTPGNCVCRVAVYQARHMGRIDQDLLHQLSEFFREEKCGVLVAGKGDFAVALFKTARGYYMFDSDDRDRYARAVPPPCRGRACAALSHYPTVQALAHRLCANVPPVIHEGSSSPKKDQSGGSSPTKDRNGGSSPTKDRSGGASPTKDRSGGASPTKDRSGGSSPTKNRNGGSSPTKDLNGSLSPVKDLSGTIPVKEEKTVRVEEPAQFQIYGMSVSSLRRLNQHEQ